MHIVISGGGSGGHAFPAIEIAQAFLRHNPSIRLTFVGNKNSIEERLAHEHKIPFHAIKAKRFVGQGLLKQLSAMLFLFFALLKSLGFLLFNRPRAVVGVGGFVSVPVMLASFLLGIDSYICEQNLIPGQANRLLAKLAKKIFLSFPESERYFPKNKCVFTGNPVRPAFALVKRPKTSDSFRILVSGGSQGARFLNQEVPKSLALLKKSCPDLKISHQVGKNDLATVSQSYKDLGLTAEVLAFIDNMPKAFSEHDLLISRAGATVIAEILCAGMPAILIPYPFAGGHQKANALALVNKNASLMIEEGPQFVPELAQSLQFLYSNQEERFKLSERARARQKNQAAEDIIKEILNKAQ
jgi:UDP-N-acetylglucosamine--N-acetylmuramyl-(pentapeptide) pyrophosphoryl-undecaprenol N-acetylglucosamine transferase